MTEFQKPDNISDEDWEEMLEEHENAHTLDHWDTLESIRKSLNDSHIESMHYLKKHSKYGKNCPYYIKALTLFKRDQAADILSLLDQFKEELEAALEEDQ